MSSVIQELQRVLAYRPEPPMRSRIPDDAELCMAQVFLFQAEVERHALLRAYQDDIDKPHRAYLLAQMGINPDAERKVERKDERNVRHNFCGAVWKVSPCGTFWHLKDDSDFLKNADWNPELIWVLIWATYERTLLWGDPEMNSEFRGMLFRLLDFVNHHRAGGSAVPAKVWRPVEEVRAAGLWAREHVAQRCVPFYVKLQDDEKI